MCAPSGHREEQNWKKIKCSKEMSVQCRSTSLGKVRRAHLEFQGTFAGGSGSAHAPKRAAGRVRPRRWSRARGPGHL